jgi:hypothetical protein
MSDSRFTEFVSIFSDRVREARLGEPDSEGVTPLDPREIAFTRVFLEDMEDVGLVADSDIVHFEKKLGRANAKLNGFCVSDDEGELTLITTIFGGEASDELKSAPGGEISKAIKAAAHVFRAAKDPFHPRMEKSSEQRDMIERLHSVQGEIGSIRVLVLINGLTGKQPELEQPDDIPKVTVDVWDLERLFRAASSGLAYESVKIDLERILGAPLPCLPGPETSENHRCYFTIVPGDLLHALYHEHGPRLLELNVRSFLQARGKVNRGIRDTLHDDPGCFLAYNNGISATVESLDLVEGADGAAAIRQITGLQIVNGGQTVASIHRAKDRDKVDLSNVYVQAKITKIDPAHVDDLVPLISRFSNTQNKVNETDFSANHPFHVKFQQLSASVWPPGETTRWFYERARGQWEVARVREGTTTKRLHAFDQRSPRSQKVDKNLLAKAVNAWNELPHTVSLGGQKCFVGFMKELTRMGDAWEPDDNYYRDSIAKIIIFKRAEKIGRQIAFSAYRANAICYTVALVAYRTCGRTNLNAIWRDQDVSDALEETMRSWMPRIHEEIVESAEGRNVTEWSKKKECWAMIQSLDLEFAAGFESELAEGQPLPTVGKFSEKKGAKPKTLSHEERERQAKVMKLGPDDWQNVIAWMVARHEYAGFPVQICGTILGYAAGGWKQIPSPRQTKSLVTFIDAWNGCRTDQEEE